MGGKSKRSAAVESGLSCSTAAQAVCEDPALDQAAEAADYWTPAQLEPAGVCTRPLMHLSWAAQASGRARSSQVPGQPFVLARV